MPINNRDARLSLEHRLGTALIKMDPVLERVNAAANESFYASRPARAIDVVRATIIYKLLCIIDSHCQRAKAGWDLDRERREAEEFAHSLELGE